MLAGVCLFVFWNGLGAPLLLDNQPIILNDPRIRALDASHLGDIFSKPYWWPTLESRLFRPLTTLTYALNYAGVGGGPSPTGYHVVNLLLHWVNAVLVFALVRVWSGRRWAALATAMLWAVHPLTVESVTNVVGRADLLAALAVLGALLVHERLVSRGGGWRPALLAALSSIFAAGVFCKESAVVLPALMAMRDASRPGGTGIGGTATWRSRLGLAGPAYLALLPGLVVLAYARWALFHDSVLFGEFGSDNPIAMASGAIAVMTAIKVVGYYLALVVWPASLSCDYSFSAITLFGGTLATGQDPHAWMALATLAGLAAAAVALWRRGQQALGFWLAFAFVAFLPTSNLLLPIGTIMAERLMYLPLVGVVAAVVLTAARVLGWWLDGASPVSRQRGVAAAAMVVMAIAAAEAARTIVRNDDWGSETRLWNASIQAAPNSIKLLRGQAAAVMATDPSGGRADEAVAILRRGIRLLEEQPLPLRHTPAALYEETGAYLAAKATLQAQQGAREAAEATLRLALPHFERAAQIDRAINEAGRQTRLAAGIPADHIFDVGTFSIYRHLGTTYWFLGDVAKAAETFAYLARIHPESDDAHLSVGVSEAALAEMARRQNREDDVRLHVERATSRLIQATILNPANADAWRVLDQLSGSQAPDRRVVVSRDGRFALNRSRPDVQHQFERACRDLLNQFESAGRTDDAVEWRRRMIDELAVSDSALQ